MQQRARTGGCLLLPRTARLATPLPPDTLKRLRVAATRLMPDPVAHGRWHLRQNGIGAWTELWAASDGRRTRDFYVASYTNTDAGLQLAEMAALLSPQTVYLLTSELLRRRAAEGE